VTPYLTVTIKLKNQIDSNISKSTEHFQVCKPASMLATVKEFKFTISA
jgi:hypothetical protein